MLATSRLSADVVFLGHAAEGCCNFSISTPGHVLIAQGGLGSGVAESPHEFGQRGIGLRRQDCAGVSQVVPA